MFSKFTSNPIVCYLSPLPIAWYWSSFTSQPLAVISLLTPPLQPVFQIYEVLEDFQTTHALVFRTIKHIASDILFFLNLTLIKKTNILGHSSDFILFRKSSYFLICAFSHGGAGGGRGHICTSWKVPFSDVLLLLFVLIRPEFQPFFIYCMTFSFGFSSEE